MPELIKVAARVRPSAGDGDAAVLANEAQARAEVNGRKYVFDAVFGQNSTQDAVFQSVARPIIDGCVSGYNGTVFVYGQTGSGKTFTMLGAENDDGEIDVQLRGLIPRSLEHLFDALQREQERKGSTFNYTCRCCFVELYNEDLYDLLVEDRNAKLKLRQTDTVEVEGVTEETIQSCDDAIDVLMQGWKNRKVAETAMNRESSRSHAIFIVSLETVCEYKGVINRKRSRINLVDLAGSERQEHTKSSGARLKEAASINKSLSTLTRVIDRLSLNAIKREHGHVPYRDSKLTHLLSDSLGGNARTAVIVNVHPDSRFLAQTVSTLKFAENVKHIENAVKVNEDVTTRDIEAWKAEILRLKEELRAKENFKPPQDDEFAKLTSQNATLAEMLRESQKRVASLQETVDLRFQTMTIMAESKGLSDFEDRIQSLEQKCLSGRQSTHQERTPARNYDAVIVHSLKQELRTVTQAKERLEMELEELKESATNSSFVGDRLQLSEKERRHRRRTRYTPLDDNKEASKSFAPVLEPICSEETDDSEKTTPVLLDFSSAAENNSAYQQEIEQLKYRIEQLTEEASKLNETVLALREANTGLTRQADVRAERAIHIDSLKTQLQELQAKIEQREKENTHLTIQNREASRKMAELQELFTSKQDELNRQIATLEKQETEHNKQVQVLKDLLLQKDSEITKRKAAVASGSVQIHDLQQRLDELMSEKTLLKEQVQKLQAAQMTENEMKQKMEQYQQELVELRAQRADQALALEQQKSELELARKALIDEQAKEKSAFAAVHNELSLLTEQMEDLRAADTAQLDAMETKDQEIADLRGKLAEHEKEKLKLSDEMERAKNLIADQKCAIATLQKDFSSEKKELVKVHKEEKAKLTQQVAEMAKRMDEYHPRTEETEQPEHLNKRATEVDKENDWKPQKQRKVREPKKPLDETETVNVVDDQPVRRSTRQSARTQSKKT